MASIRHNQGPKQAFGYVAIATIAVWTAGTCAALPNAVAQPPRVLITPADPLVRDRDPLLPDSFNPPRSRVFVTRDAAEFVRFLGRVRANETTGIKPPAKVQPQGIEVIDGKDADRDGYVEYFDGGAYVAELKLQGFIEKDSTLLQLAGTVREESVTTFEEDDDPHLLLRVQHDEGKHALVDAGPADALAKLSIRPGDRIKILAHLGLVNNHPALIAEQIVHDRATVKIVRPPIAR